jgi:hypothetical protein
MESADADESGTAEIVRISIVSRILIGTVSVSTVGIVAVTAVGIASVVVSVCPNTRREHQTDRRE